MNIVITGYYQKQNLGDDLFKNIAKKLFTKFNHIKTNIISIDKLNLPENRHNIDRIILFGGETLNNYFIDKLIEMKKYNPEIKYTAIGVSCNQTYSEVLNKINIFEYILFRSQKDYDFFKRYIKCDFAPDIVLSLKHNIHLNTREKIGFFLSQTAIHNISKEKESEYINTIVNFIKDIINKHYSVYLFSMCTNNKYSEDDNFINSKIYSKFNQDDRKYIKVRFSICWRYHAHILCIINKIPFISISNTPKVIDLLNTNDLVDNHSNIFELDDKFRFLEQNEIKLKRKLNKIYKSLHKKTKIYFNKDIYLLNKDENTFYIEPQYYNKIYDYLLQRFNKLKENENDYFNTQIVTFFFTKKLENDYNYGLSEKINKGIENLKNDIFWLINDSILQKNLYFYENLIETFNIKSIKKGKLNIRYINQSDYVGLHRSGWQYVVDELDKFHDSHEILCDLYLDRTFHWNQNDYSKLNIIPYKRDWIGFIHHTCDEEYTSYNTVNLFKNKLFIQSLSLCRGLIVLSEDLKFKIEKILYNLNLYIHVYSLTHPTEFPNIKFDMKKFNNNNERKIIQIGAWMRNIQAINELHVNNLVKSVLIGKKMNNYYNLTTDSADSDSINSINSINSDMISRDNKDRRVDINNRVKIITHLENNDYDNLLSENIVFLNLIGASAVNTLIECVVRNTPIVINKLPSVIEILGDSYPLLYDDIEELTELITIQNIEKAHIYLKKLDKTKLKIETFKSNLFNLPIYSDANKITVL
jgi:polysaccharide pyruvyl transferase WcaK-like protein